MRHTGQQDAWSAVGFAGGRSSSPVDFATEFSRPNASAENGEFALADGSRIGVIGGGPAGAFFAYFLLETAERAGLDLAVDVFEARDFTRPGPAGCNMCGGVVSESMVQTLATEGICFPDTVVQRGLDSFVVHSRERTAYMDIPLHERRIAAMHRGSGPKNARVHDWESFDGFLLDAADARGATVIHGRVSGIGAGGPRPTLEAGGETYGPYDLVVDAAGVNSAAWKLFSEYNGGFEPPQTNKSYVGELYVGKEWIDEVFGSSMHVFMLALPGLEFAGLLPKGQHLTLVMLGEGVNEQFIEEFLTHPAVRECLPPGWTTELRDCQCRPKLNSRGMARPYADRLLFLGDAGITRYNKDGIGAAYRAAKAAAVTAVFDGVSAKAFAGHYMRTCAGLERDNRYGRVIFGLAGIIQAVGPARRGMMRMLIHEQARESSRRHMSGILWDTFTGSAPYRDVFFRFFHPAFIGGILWHVALSLSPRLSTTAHQEGS
jgi:flavin-dependent dehydrogenase